MRAKADLHIHSTLSDGSNDRMTILSAALAKGISHLAFTEHDTMDGFSQWAPAAAAMGIVLIAGVEFTAYDYQHNVRAHILGYDMNDSSPIEALGKPQLALRHSNSLRQIEILRELGYAIDLEEVRRLTQGDTIYKQHIMHVMVNKGYAETIGGETYRRLFKNGGPCSSDISYIDAGDAVRAILDAGGVPVLAHPGQQDNLRIVPQLAGLGLRGLELCHHANSADHQRRIRETAGKYGLILTGGSDHHGLYEENSPEVGDYCCPAELPFFADLL
jgi:predicted metal-dependent phosphoesterase TrpH